MPNSAFQLQTWHLSPRLSRFPVFGLLLFAQSSLHCESTLAGYVGEQGERLLARQRPVSRRSSGPVSLPLLFSLSFCLATFHSSLSFSFLFHPLSVCLSPSLSPDYRLTIFYYAFLSVSRSFAHCVRSLLPWFSPSLRICVSLSFPLLLRLSLSLFPPPLFLSLVCSIMSS